MSNVGQWWSLGGAAGGELLDRQKICKICEDEDFVAILSDSADMYEKFNENPDGYMRVVNSNLLQIVY